MIGNGIISPLSPPNETGGQRDLGQQPAQIPHKSDTQLATKQRHQRSRSSSARPLVGSFDERASIPGTP